MSVKPPLYGSGALEGTADSRSLTFTVTSDIGTLVFTGVHEGEQITGTYTVQHPTGGLETGSFKLSKESTSNPVLPTETMHRAHTPVGSTNISPPEKAPEVEESPKVVPQPSSHSDPKNYSSCMNGVSYACNKALLTPDEAMNVKANDFRRNYSSCMNGVSYGCNKGLLTPEEAAMVSARREHALLVKINKQAELAVRRFELGLEVAFIVLIDGPVEGPEFTFNLFVERDECGFRNIAIGFVSCLPQGCYSFLFLRVASRKTKIA
jgi:hypothetical protein